MRKLAVGIVALAVTGIGAIVSTPVAHADAEFTGENVNCETKYTGGGGWPVRGKTRCNGQRQYRIKVKCEYWWGAFPPEYHYGRWRNPKIGGKVGGWSEANCGGLSTKILGAWIRFR